MSRAKFAFCWVAVLSLLASAKAVRADEDLYSNALKSVGFVLCYDRVKEQSLGTAVLVDVKKRHFVTAAHVIDGIDHALMFAPAKDSEGRLITDRKWYADRAKTLGVPINIPVADEGKDLAVLRVDRVPDGMAAMPLAGKGAGTGQTVHAIGNSGMTDDGLWRYRQGHVRQVCMKKIPYGRKTVEAYVIETDLLSNPGDSGGPVYNDKGELVAITSGGSRMERGTDYCIDITEIKKILTNVPETLAPTTQRSSDPWEGYFASEDNTLLLRKEGESYVGVLKEGYHKVFKVKGAKAGTGLELNFDDRGEPAKRTLKLEGDKLTLQGDEGATSQLVRKIAPAGNK